MNFDEWCEKEEIKEYWKEALYLAVAEKIGASKVNSANEGVWSEAWKKILDYALKLIK